MGKNLTTGSVFRTIVTFALPYLLSYFLQTLYGMADLFIAGQFIGIDGRYGNAKVTIVLNTLPVVRFFPMGCLLSSRFGLCLPAGRLNLTMVVESIPKHCHVQYAENRL